MKTQHIKEIVINWHITEACNYSCRYCYAHWCKPKVRELIHDKVATKALLTEINNYFSPDNHENPLTQMMTWSSVRLNIAGGEPLLYPKQTRYIAETATGLGMKVSMITNGSYLTEELMIDLAPHLSLLGISLDATHNEINKLIGRSDNKGHQLFIDELQIAIRTGQRLNPEMQLKLNTVVNKANYHHDMSKLVKTLKPNRWKVLRMLPVLNSDLSVDDMQFCSFIAQHASFSELMCIEDNDQMSESYIMVDPLGRFFQNSENSGTTGYAYSSPIIESGADRALKEINFCTNKFLERYQGIAA